MKFVAGTRLFPWALPILLFVSLLPVPAFSSCEVEEVIELVDEDLSRRMIKDECENQVEEAGKCSLSRVIRYAKKSMSADEIYEKCDTGSGDRSSNSTSDRQTQPAIGTRCDTPYGSCPIVTGFSPVGGTCFCQFWNGRAYGIAR